ncbi:MAG: YdhR family protein [Balneolaceae bacterium]|jgi:heme-degrading monooxygenase HmoA
MIAQIVRFKSEMTDEEVQKMYESRSPRYRALPGLKQKIYLRFTETGEHGAVYLWESKKDIEEFRKSELSRTIPTAYQVKGDADIQLAEVAMTLRPMNVS